MGKYAGTLYIPPENCKIIQDVLENKELFCSHVSDMTFSVELKYFGDDIYDMQAIDEKMIAIVSIAKNINGSYKLQVIGYICNLKTMSEKFICIKKYNEVYGEHHFVINTKEAILRVYRR